jgi:DNA-binding NtrC family response regulator
VARTIHERAARGGGHFAKVDCALLTNDILAQTFQDLRSGEVLPTETTLLLHDVERLPPSMYAAVYKLVRESLGTRIVASSRLLPEAWTSQSPVAIDLACALATLVIELPPLVARMADLPLLVQALVEECNALGAKQISGMASAALEQLSWHEWSGNLHELREVVRAAHETASGQHIEPGDLSPRLAYMRESATSPRPKPEVPIVLEDFLREIQTELITRALDRTGGNRTRAALLLGMSRVKFYRRLEQLGLVENKEEEPIFEEDPN